MEQPMTSRAQALKQLSAVQFKLWDMHLYLDTHWSDIAMQNQYKRTAEQYNTMRQQFEAQFGPLSAGSGSGREWLQDPWPWDIEGRTANV